MAGLLSAKDEWNKLVEEGWAVRTIKQIKNYEHGEDIDALEDEDQSVWDWINDVIHYHNKDIKWELDTIGSTEDRPYKVRIWRPRHKKEAISLTFYQEDSIIEDRIEYAIKLVSITSCPKQIAERKKVENYGIF